MPQIPIKNVGITRERKTQDDNIKYFQIRRQKALSWSEGLNCVGLYRINIQNSHYSLSNDVLSVLAHYTSQTVLFYKAPTQ